MDLPECLKSLDEDKVDLVRRVLKPEFVVESEEMISVQCSNGKFYVDEKSVLIVDVDGIGEVLTQNQFKFKYRDATDKDYRCWEELQAWRQGDVAVGGGIDVMNFIPMTFE